MEMLSVFSFCYIWFLQIVPIGCHENSTGLYAGSSGPADRLFSPALLRVLVPEEHHLCLRCGGFHGSDVVWTRQNREILTGSGDAGRRRRVLSDGLLCLQQLDDSDSGQYRCDGRLVAELQVLTGSTFVVTAGWTLLLPCSPPHKAKQRWFHRRRGGRREPVFTRFRNGTVRPERDGNRLSFGNDALQILDLQPEDAGEYQCGELQVRVIVLLDPTRISTSSATTASFVVMETDEFGTKRKDQKRLENALLLAAVAGLGMMSLLLAALCAVQANVKCRRVKRSRHRATRGEDTDMQSWTTSSPQTEYEEFESQSLHYASLGRQNWGERASRTPPDQNHGVVYSSVVTIS
ncbi:uncharacterized protein LOC114866137 isoform X2 [Betta splendens]|uniref:Uncharacterized protein LOC114866137 isoform X2 n=1 Tax=Betta splendens TaxID=158456 RepID=A0A6P7P1X6_BETSP|nr:uncharacterized protein LOC114866137 isoform X2 [Betta splendens]